MRATLAGLRRSPRLVAGALALAAVAAAAVLLWWPWRSVTEDAGLAPERPFVAHLGGPLYAARTLRDQDGAPDVAYLDADVPLHVRVRATLAGTGIPRVDLLVDGRLAGAHVVPCGRRGCPRSVAARFTPALLARGVGSHRMQVVVTAPHGRATATVARFDVNVGGSASPAREVDPRRVARAAPMTHRNAAADAIVGAASAAGGTLQPLLGRSRLVLRDSGRGSGRVTVLAGVEPLRRDVTATLPQLDGQQARMRAATLADLLVDVDVRRRRVIGVQPGPASRVTAWTASAEPAATVTEEQRLAGAFRPSHRPRMLALSDHGPSFLTQDGDPTLRGAGRDWPVSMIFTGAATITKIKAGLRQLGLVRRGHPRFLRYRTTSDLVRFDGDRGLKNACDRDATDLHIRLYAPTATDTFLDPGLGRFVVATVHIDHRDGCGVGPQEYGFSENAERTLAALIGVGLKWRATIDQYPLGNAEPLRRDHADPTHIWQSDGLATGVVVP
jgi:hypothetical protein